jgi:hypothetical protein
VPAGPPQTFPVLVPGVILYPFSTRPRSLELLRRRCLENVAEKRGGWRVMATQPTCNRIPYETSECLAVTSHTSSRRRTAGPITQRMSIWRAGAGVGALRVVWRVATSHPTTGSGRWAGPNVPWQRTPGARRTVLSHQQAKVWQVPVSPLPSLLAPGALPSDLVPNGALINKRMFFILSVHLRG